MSAIIAQRLVTNPVLTEKRMRRLTMVSVVLHPVFEFCKRKIRVPAIEKSETTPKTFNTFSRMKRLESCANVLKLNLLVKFF